MDLGEVAHGLAARLCRLFTPDADGQRPCHGDERRYATDPAWKELVLFYEYFNGDSGKGHGASHQTGWTALVTRCLEDAACAREHEINGAAAERENEHHDDHDEVPKPKRAKPQPA